MSSDPRPLLRPLALALLVALTIAGEVKGAASSPPLAAETSGEDSPAAGALARQVAEIARSPASKTRKEKQISLLVRSTLAAANAGNRPALSLETTLQFVESAAAAAPAYAEVIASATVFSPAVSHLNSASGQIRRAAFTAARKGPGQRPTAIAGTSLGEVASRATSLNDDPSLVPRIKSRGRSQPAGNRVDSGAPDQELGSTGTPLERNIAFSLTADLSIRHDDNVFLTSSDEVSDTVIAVSPGLEFRFGQNSLAHGQLTYRNAFTRYVDQSAPNVSLADASASFGYNSGSTAIEAAAYFQQLNQNSPAVAAIGQRAIYRRDVLGMNANIESNVTAKTSVKSGVNYNKSKYKVAGLSGSTETEIPLKVYFAATPKVSVSTGLAYRRVAVQSGGDQAKDWSYDVGARGNFTAKLNGEFSFNYRTRTVGKNPKESLWGFNGALNYELTPKTTTAFVFGRDFSTGARGESLKNSNYSFRISTLPTPQWELSASVGYRRIEYGPSVFSVSPAPLPSDRRDGYWESGVQATYLFRSWLTLSADYSLRNNHSTLSPAEFSNNILSLVLGWRY